MLRSSVVQLISGRMLLYQSTLISSLDSIKFNKSSKTSSLARRLQQETYMKSQRDTETVEAAESHRRAVAERAHQ
ncbi:hypothetical protein TNCV_1852231 [Trichonephila clavipes]|nr:hypothetical protein TNCV_1852231 [Trichonephila clavipes]